MAMRGSFDMLVVGNVTELIPGFGIARSVEAMELELMHAVFPHQILSEAMHEAVLSAYGHAQHI
jgi:dihydrolipoamide dehydrogenase